MKATRSFSCFFEREVPKVVGMTPFLKPFAMYASGLTIDSLMNAARAMLPSAFASAAGALSRSGPIVPVAPAGWNVWHEPQPFEAKTDWPAAALPPLADVVVAAEVVEAVEVAAVEVVAVEVVPVEVVVAGDGPAAVTVRTLEGFPPSEV